MSKYKQTSSGILVPNKPEKIEMTHCGTCPRMIVKFREPQQRFFIKDGKAMCGICRVTKLGRIGKFILSQTPRAIKDDKIAKQTRRDREEARINQIAAESGERVLKDLNL